MLGIFCPRMKILSNVRCCYNPLHGPLNWLEKYIIIISLIQLRGRPLMIWGGGGNFRNEFIFSREPLPYKNFFPEKGLRNYFFLDFLRPHPQIINGRPLVLGKIPKSLLSQPSRHIDSVLILIHMSEYCKQGYSSSTG